MHKLEIELTDEEYETLHAGLMCGWMWLSILKYDEKELSVLEDRVYRLKSKLFPKAPDKKERRSQPGC